MLSGFPCISDVFFSVASNSRTITSSKLSPLNPIAFKRSRVAVVSLMFVNVFSGIVR